MHALTKKEFSRLLSPDVAAFDCGDVDGVWCSEVSAWIRDLDLPFKAMSRYKTKVWLYYHPDGRLIGYGTLGTTNWEWPGLDRPKKKMFHIPFLGVAREFRGKPEVDGAVRYARQVIDDLIEEARRWPMDGVEPLVSLFVDERNEAAMKFYRKVGFRDYHEKKVPTDTTAGKYHLGMILPL